MRRCFLFVFVLGVAFALLATQTKFLLSLTSLNPALVGLSPAFTANLETAWNYNHLADGALNDKVALVTGANVGLGYWTSLHLAKKGAKVVMACRNIDKCKRAAEEIKGKLGQTKGTVVPIQVNLGSLASVQKFTKEFSDSYGQLDIVVANAAAVFVPYALTADGIETIFATNHIGHFKLVKDLQDLIVKTAEKSGAASIVVISSASHYEPIPGIGVHLELDKINDPVNYDAMIWYGQSKLANVLYVQELAERLQSTKVYVNAAHPGLVATNVFNAALDFDNVDTFTVLLSKFASFFVPLAGWTGEEGARNQVYLAAALDELKAKDIRGQYFHPIGQRMTPSPFAQNATLQKGLWEFSEALLKERGF